jgi:hypothetical protein
VADSAVTTGVITIFIFYKQYFGEKTPKEQLSQAIENER